MGQYINQLGQQAGSAAASAAGSAIGSGIFGGIQELVHGKRIRKRQLEQQEKLTKLAEESGKRMGQFEQQLAKDMFDYTAEYNLPANEMKRLKEAGLNPALMYGLGGGEGGSTAGAGTANAAQGGQASDEASMRSAQASEMGMGIQAGMAQAQIRVLNSQADKNEAEATRTAGTQTELDRATIAEITERTGNYQIQRVGMMLENDLREVEKFFSMERGHLNIRKLESEINNLEQSTKEFFEKTRNAKLQGDITEDAYIEILNSYELENELKIAQAFAAVSNGKLSLEQAKIIAKDYGIRLSQLGLNMDHNNIERERNRIADTTNEVLRMNNITGVAGSLIQGIATMGAGTVIGRKMTGSRGVVKGFAGGAVGGH